ncbi:glycosyltransferase [Marinobacter maritimus]|uniref:glycosyltransferase n=1 Tax=Marinobacter maritimus TaxID=277961 RepID=UPI0011AA692F|nr:glycosyltransferase [Marinobacter maritimus]
MKVAKIIEGSPDNKMGLFNDAILRTKRLKSKVKSVDCYMVRVRYSFALRILKGKIRLPPKERVSLVDGIWFKNLWVKIGLLDYILVYKLNARAFLCERSLRKYDNIFRGFDVITSHGLLANVLAKIVNENQGLPYVPTWHGSDINIYPFKNDRRRIAIKYIMDSAYANVFVSNKLMETSCRISKKSNKEVLYSSINSIFFRFSEERRNELRRRYSIQNKKVVGFVGNLIDIKNVMVLAPLFRRLQDSLEDVAFFIVGEGNRSFKLQEEMSKLRVNNVTFFGKLDPVKIPEIMNVIDILVLPSLNEGLPLVTLEALSCGAHVVGSDRGGIPEAIGVDNTFRLDDCFVDNCSKRILEVFEGRVQPPKISNEFSEVRTCKRERSLLSEAVSKR